MNKDEVVVIVEIPRGSRNKYEYDDALGAIVLDRRLFTSTVYPADYGFVEGALGGDGDPLDALVLVGDPTFPGCRIRVRIVGVFRMVDEEGPDEKLLCVPLRDPLWSETRDVGDIPGAFRAEIEQFFKIYKDLEGVATRTAGFGDRIEALQVLEEARERVSAR
jgi:inorganic pyrophosphatase